MRLERKEENDRLVNIVYGLFEQLARGDVLPWASIEAATGMLRHEGKFDHIVKRARNKLRREREIVTYAERANGLRLLTHQEAALLVPKARQERAKRQYTRGINELRCVDGASLTDHQRRQTALQLKQMMDNRRAVKKSLKQHAKAMVTETIPRRQAVQR